MKKNNEYLYWLAQKITRTNKEQVHGLFPLWATEMPADRGMFSDVLTLFTMGRPGARGCGTRRINAQAITPE